MGFQNYFAVVMDGEKKVVIRLKEGNRLAFTMVYMEYHKQLYSFACHYLGDRYQAEDAIQWLFLRLWENRQLLNEQMSLKSYLFTSLKNHLLNLLRDGKRESLRQEEFMREKEEAEEHTVFQHLDEEELRKRLTAAISTLSPQKRKICELKLKGNLSNAEIAELLQISVNTVKFQYNQIIKELRSRISPALLLVLSFLFLLP
ncbi:MAG: RNA polymerase sigma-70 factor [Odoribacter sp.]|nr:RNA polymerase sigma-70 factor [Odoribacter sp.]